jgi:hypothetical protein
MGFSLFGKGDPLRDDSVGWSACGGRRRAVAEVAITGGMPPPLVAGGSELARSSLIQGTAIARWHTGNRARIPPNRDMST